MALSKGLLAPVGGEIPSVWSGKTTAGLLGGSPLTAPMPTYAAPVFAGGSKYGNYVRHYPGLMAAFSDPTNEGEQNIVDWGKQHWETFGQYNPSRLNPATFGINPALSRGDVMDTGPAATRLGESGLPMPDVEGYRYAYRPYEWSQEAGGYEELAYNEFDIDKYPYYPYLPTGGRAQERNNRILVGLRLVPD